MKLYNNSRIPDSVLEAVLYKAGKAVGARTTNVVVQVNTSRTCSCKGQAWHYGWVRNWKGMPKGRQINTDGGMFQITLPIPRPWFSNDLLKRNCLKFAESFFKVARHEWAHVKDYQQMDEGKYLEWSRKSYSGGRRPKWANRPEEQRAENHCASADLNGRDSSWACDEIIDLAFELENLFAKV